MRFPKRGKVEPDATSGLRSHGVGLVSMTLDRTGIHQGNVDTEDLDNMA